VKLSKSKIATRLARAPGWSVKANALVRQYGFESFPDVVAFVTRLGFDAQANDHHPDMTISYRKITVAWSTHSAGGITQKDFAGAADADRIARAFPQKP
jgi:4a-hydroxytetrahydrobiopterin dehydratase